MTRYLVPWLRRAVQIVSILVLVALPLLALYTHYSAARAIGDLPRESWRGKALRGMDRLVGENETYGKIVETTQGTFWSARILGVSLTDPLAGAEAIVSSRSLYVPLLWSLAAPVVLSLVLGRVFCGWICPMNTLLEVVDRCRRWLGLLEIRERDVRFSKSTKYVLLVIALGSVALTGIPFLAMVYPPAVISREAHLLVFGSGIGLGAYLILAVCAFELLVSRRWWCRYICPGGAVYSLMGLTRLLRIRRDADRCVQCGDCIQACQFDLRPMLVETTGMECTNCASCIRVCNSKALGYGVSLPGFRRLTRGNIADEPARGQTSVTRQTTNDSARPIAEPVVAHGGDGQQTPNLPSNEFPSPGGEGRGA